jgi:hypothetical protein
MYGAGKHQGERWEQSKFMEHPHELIILARVTTYEFGTATKHKGHDQ